MGIHTGAAFGVKNSETHGKSPILAPISYSNLFPYSNKDATRRIFEDYAELIAVGLILKGCSCLRAKSVGRLC